LILAAAGYPAASYAALLPPSSDTYVEGLNANTDTGAVVNPPGGASSPGTANFDVNNDNVVSSAGQAIATTSYGSALAGPSVYAIAQSYVGTFTAYASLNYYFDVTGPSAGITQIDLSAFVNATTNPGTTGFSSEASFGISDVSNPGTLTSGEVLITCVVGDCPPNPAPFLASPTAMVNVNDVYEVSMVVEAQAGTSNNPSIENILTASVDPQIHLDPSDASGLSLVFSDGINEPAGLVSTAPVPLPDSFLLMLCGLGFVALVAVPRKAA
jgi:hypothetical protein